MVGPTGSGKTTCYRVLAHALTELEPMSTDEYYANIHMKVINPKMLTKEELFGQQEKERKNWSDGLASKIIRKFADKKPFLDPKRPFNGTSETSMLFHNKDKNERQ